MSTAAKTLQISVTANTSKAKAELSGFQRTLQGFAGQAKGLFVGLAAGFTLDKAVDFFKGAIESASEFEVEANKVRQVFKDSAGEVMAFAEQANTAFGLTKTEAMDATATFGVFGKSIGLAGDDLVQFSETMTQLSTDVSTFFGGSTTEAVQAFQSALMGNTEAVKKYDILLADSTLRQRAFEEGITSTTKKALTPQQKVWAAYKEILDQTQIHQGDFIRQQDSLQAQTKIVKSAFHDLQMELGGAFFEALGGSANVAGDLVEVFEDLKPLLRDLGEFTGNYAGDLLYLITSLRDLVNAAEDAGESLGWLGNVMGAVTGAAKMILGGPIPALANGLRSIKGESDKAAAAALKQAAAEEKRAIALDKIKTVYNRAAAAQMSGEMKAKAEAEKAAAAAAEKKKAAEKAAKEAEKAARKSAAGASKAETERNKAEKEWADKYSASVEKLAKRVSDAGKAADDARKQYDDFAGSVMKALTSGFDLKGAIKDEFENIKTIADLDKVIAEAIKEGDEKGRAKAEAEKAAALAAGTWIDTFYSQIDDTQKAADSIKRLKAALTNEAGKPIEGADELVKQILTLDPAYINKAVGDIIDKGIAPEMAQKLKDTAILNDEASKALADSFYGEGLKDADALLAGLQKQAVAKSRDFAKVGKGIGKDIADGIREQIAKVLEEAKNARSDLRAGTGSSMLGAPVSHHITINAPLGDPVAIARQIENVLATANRRTGMR